MAEDKTTLTQEPVEIDPEKVERLQRWIILKENKNIKSGELGETEMIKQIRKRIEEEVDAIKVN